MEFPHSQIERELARCRVDWEELSRAEHERHFQEWRRIYDNFYGPEWRRLRGERAIAEAQSLCGDGFLLVPCRDPASTGWRAVGTAFRCRSGHVPDLTEASHFVDLFISPEDFSWTLLYGHEIDVFGGPEFTRADWKVPATTERARKKAWRG